jgi:predicted amidohydrolase
MRNLMFVLVAALPALAMADLIPITETIEPPAPANPSAYGMVAVVQWNAAAPTPVTLDPANPVTTAQAEDYKQANRVELAGYIRTAAQHGAKMVITPEFGIVNYPDIPGLTPEEDDFRNRDDIAPYVEAVPGPTTNYFGALAKELGIYIHVGFAEVDMTTQKYYNVVVAMDPNGNIAAKYRKINLYELETSFLTAASTPLIDKNDLFGNIGFAICADIYSSNPMSAYSDGKTDAVTLSTSWATWNTGMTTFQSAATHAHTYVLAANNVYFPDSGVINPNGSNQSWIRQTEGLAYGYLPLKSASPSKPLSPKKR